ncbi:hypothetical protein FRX31_021381 [Thalictrum thalictroides]|uniref:CCHC-type domain-containing protein n=1 Tax=Thalictrum thalictroides TaxID=46969 RepID=A0A7J6VW20_THATH|nr:hypothetical protein FRX31_021381 [Thalictrum thalictroides]
MCGFEGHSGGACRWVYTPCKEPNCKGLRMILTSVTTSNPGKKFLQCYSCASFEWLHKAMEEEGSSCNGCFSCGELGHWKKACPWTDSKCKRCDVRRRLLVSCKEQTNGWRYLKCPRCSGFEWLHHAIKAAESKAAESVEAEVTLKMSLSEFCNQFGSCSIKK